MPDSAVIALDAMGGDFGPEVVIPAAAKVLSGKGALRIILVGDEERLRACADKHRIPLDDRLTIQHASEVVEMHDEPALAMRKKKDSSMRVAINQVHDGVADAVVSAGNTGALMATAKFVLKTLPGIDRPAICTTIPSKDSHTQMLDLGANVDCTAEHLFQFAVMGSVLTEAIDNLPNPRVGLLNIGSEAMKGNAQVKAADEYLADAPLNYIGFVEGDDIYSDKVDVVVCDGFVGNISLKTAEGVARLISYYMKQEFKQGLYNRLAGLIALPVLNAFRKRIDPNAYNGASLLGLKGIVVKSHGGADVNAYANAIEIAVLEVNKSVPQQIQEHIQPLLERQSA
ncbi:MAG: phosphate acyltransferase PlsX [Thiotrichales bacterium]|nr:MAG: phosphate acyltransferase PlsX [Thiotrichales bacterium]